MNMVYGLWFTHKQIYVREKNNEVFIWEINV